MLTEFGRELRKFRIDNGELLKDMAQKMNVSSAYLSAMENGKRNIPDWWINKLASIYDIDEDTCLRLEKTKLKTIDTVTISIQKTSNTGRKTVLKLSEVIDDIDNDTMNRIYEILNQEFDQEHALCTS